MNLEYREWQGVRMTYLSGKNEPIWLVAALVQKLGHISRAAYRLRWNRQFVRAAVYHAEWNAPTMRQERAAALEAGFHADVLMDSPHGLVFPGAMLRGKPPSRRRSRRCRYCW